MSDLLVPNHAVETLGARIHSAEGKFSSGMRVEFIVLLSLQATVRCIAFCAAWRLECLDANGLIVADSRAYWICPIATAS